MQFGTIDSGEFTPRKAIVDQTVGAGKKILASTIDRYGGVAKEVATGYVLGKVEGDYDSEELAVMNRNINDPVEIGDDYGFTEVAQYLDQTGNRKEAQFLAIQKKSQAIAQYPWARDAIEKSYQNFFAPTKTNKHGLLGESKEDVVKQNLLKMSLRAVEAGVVRFDPEMSDEQLVAEFVKYQQTLFKQQQEANEISRAAAQKKTAQEAEDYVLSGLKSTTTADLSTVYEQVSTRITNVLSDIQNQQGSEFDIKGGFQTAVAQVIDQFVDQQIDALGSDFNVTPRFKNALREQTMEMLQPLLDSLGTEGSLDSFKTSPEDWSRKASQEISQAKYIAMTSGTDFGKIMTMKKLGFTTQEIEMAVGPQNYNKAIRNFYKNFDGDFSELGSAMGDSMADKLTTGDPNTSRSVFDTLGNIKTQEQFDEFYLGLSNKEKRLFTASAFDFIGNELYATMSDNLPSMYSVYGVDLEWDHANQKVTASVRDDFDGVPGEPEEMVSLVNKLSDTFTGLAYTMSARSDVGSPEQAVKEIHKILGGVDSMASVSGTVVDNNTNLEFGDLMGDDGLTNTGITPTKSKEEFQKRMGVSDSGNLGKPGVIGPEGIKGTIGESMKGLGKEISSKSRRVNYAAKKKYAPVLQKGIREAAEALGIDPVDLATVISYETVGTFNPKIDGPTTQWGMHRGLIQFGEPQAKTHGVDWDDPFNSQLGSDGAIVKYLRDVGVEPGMSLLHVYAAINAGDPYKFNASDANNGGAPGTVKDKVEKQMKGHKLKAKKLMEGSYA